MTVTPTETPHIDVPLVYARPAAGEFAVELCVYLPLLGENHIVLLDEETAVGLAADLLDHELQGQTYEEEFRHNSNGRKILASIHAGACLHVARTLLNAVAEFRNRRGAAL